MDNPRVCATCKHFEFTESEREYSYGNECSFKCQKGYWHCEGGDCTEVDFRSSMMAATVCQDYDPVCVEPVKLAMTEAEQERAIADLERAYPQFQFKIEFLGKRWDGSFNLGSGWLVGSFVTRQEAILSIKNRFETTTTEEPNAVPTD